MPNQEQVPSWYHGATGDWAQAPPMPGTPHIPTKADVQDTIRTLVGRKDINDTSTSKPTDWSSFFKDLTTDAASQAPLALIPEGGPGRTAVRGISSLLAGTGMDQLFNPNRPAADSAVDAALNTTVGMAVPHVLANETKYSPPDIQGTGVSAPVLKILNLINPSNWKAAPRTVTRGTTQGPKQVPRNVGDVISEAIFKNTNGKVDLSPQAILNMLGFGANAAVDATVNRPTQQDQQ